MNFEKQGRTDIGLSFKMLRFSSFLKIGVTLVTFILPEKIPVFSDKLKIFIRGVFSSL